jgi:hypothetical protein
MLSILDTPPMWVTEQSAASPWRTLVCRRRVASRAWTSARQVRAPPSHDLATVVEFQGGIAWHISATDSNTDGENESG